MVLCVSGKKKTLTAAPRLLYTLIAGKASTTTLHPITLPVPLLTPTKTIPTITTTTLLSWVTRPAHIMTTAGLLALPPSVQISPPLVLGPLLL